MANEPETRIRMDIEVSLEEDRTGSFKSSVRAGIVEQAAAVETMLKNGATPDEYRKLKALKNGLDAAILILDRTWSYYHS